MLVCAWAVFPLLTCGIWLLKHCTLPQTNQNRETCCAIKSRGYTPTPKRRNTPTEMILNYSMWITLPQTKDLHLSALLCIFQDSEAVIKMIVKGQKSDDEIKIFIQGRSPTMRHVSPTHRVALDWLFDRINFDPKIKIQCVDITNRLADNSTEDRFTHDEPNHLLRSFNIMNFSMFACTHISPIKNPQSMSKWLMQEGKPGEEERVVVDFSVEDCRPVSNSNGFRVHLTAGHTHSTKFEIGSHRYGETRCERFECKHSIESSSEAFRGKSEHQFKENLWRKQGNPLVQTTSPQL